MYESTCAVPLIIRAPGCRRDHRTPALASGVDLFPTVLDLAGIDRRSFTLDRGYTGVSLLPVLRGEQASVREEVVIEYNRFGLRHDQDDGFFPIRCLRTGRWKLAINLFDRDELYDLETDPDEAVNRIDDLACADIRNQLHERLLTWQDQSRDPLRSPQWRCRSWRDEPRPAFEGLFTTGYKQTWPDAHDFHRLPEGAGP